MENRFLLQLKISFFLGVIICLFLSCKKSSSSNNNNNNSNSQFVKGADVSWLTQMESDGIKFYNSSGTDMGMYGSFKKPGYECDQGKSLGRSY
jgi:arabinogalactan endo-1,4-beta-galactosidase